jgi:glycosyltransferase involved in cell wall biosynthesis
MIQQHPVDEERIPAAILRWTILLDSFREQGHELLAIGPNDRLAFGEGCFRGVPQLLVPTPGSGIKALDMAVFALLLPLTLLKARRRFRPGIWFVDELFVFFGVLVLRLLHPGERIVYDVMGIHWLQVRRNNRSLLRHGLLAPLYGLLEHLTLWSASAVTTVNEAHAAVLRRWTRRPVSVIRDAARFEPLRSGERVELPPKAPGEVFLTFVGKISNRRLDDLFAVLPEACHRLPALRVVIVGNGPWFDHYRREAQRIGLAGRFHWTDFVPHRHLPAHIGQADLCYSDDWSEIGFPMKVFEYMALGAAQLVEDTPAVREVLRDGENAVLYHGRGGLLAGILRLAGDRELRRRIGECAAREAREQHRWEPRIAQFGELFARLLCTTGTGRS